MNSVHGGPDYSDLKRLEERIQQLESGKAGSVTVPIDPTPQMISAGFEACRMEAKWPEMLDRIYRAMLAARPR